MPCNIASAVDVVVACLIAMSIEASLWLSKHRHDHCNTPRSIITAVNIIEVRLIAAAIETRVTASPGPSTPSKYASSLRPFKHALQQHHDRRCRHCMPHPRVHKTIAVVVAALSLSSPSKYASLPRPIKHVLQHRHGCRCRHSMPCCRVH